MTALRPPFRIARNILTVGLYCNFRKVVICVLTFKTILNTTSEIGMFKLNSNKIKMLSATSKIPKHLSTRYSKINQLSKITRSYAQAPPQQRKPPSLGGYYAIGTLTVIGGATLCYAKFDNNFRKYLKSNIPITDNVIKFVFQEEKTYKEHYTEIEQTFSDLFSFGTETPKAPKVTSITSSTQSTPSAISKSQPAPKKVDVETIEGGNVMKSVPVPMPTSFPSPILEEPSLSNVNTNLSEPEKPIKEKVEEKKPTHIVNLEQQITEAADSALKSYAMAVTALRNFTRDIDSLVEQNFEKIDPKVWHNLKVLSEQKDQSVKAAEQNAKEALETVRTFKSMVEKKAITVADHLYGDVIQNIRRIEKGIEDAKSGYIKEIQNTIVTERFWDKVEAARKQYQDELGILCPSIKIEEPKLNLSEGEIDLFILHAQKKIQYLQKELAKMETKREVELMKALEKARDSGNAEPLIEEQIKVMLEKEKRELMENFHKKALEIQADAERDIKAQLKRQAEAHSDHLTDAMKTKESELQRDFNRQLSEEILKAKLDYKTQLAAMVGRLKGVDTALKVRADADRNAHQAQALWSACQALHQAIKSDEFGEKNADLQPLSNEITAIKTAASDNDELVQAVIKSIPDVARERGVYNESLLRERFPKVETVARRLALVPDEGARLPVYLMSYIQSLLLVNASSPISKEELSDEIVDFSEFTTNDVLQRAKYWLDRGDFHQTLRYMNLLTGASRVVAEQWMKEVQILLETKQAANTLMAHAAANGLVYL